jgi:hypothetical protein
MNVNKKIDVNENVEEITQLKNYLYKKILQYVQHMHNYFVTVIVHYSYK